MKYTDIEKVLIYIKDILAPTLRRVITYLKRFCTLCTGYTFIDNASDQVIIHICNIGNIRPFVCAGFGLSSIYHG